MAADPTPPQQAAAAAWLHQPQRVSPHAGVPAALLDKQPGSRRTPRGHGGDVTPGRPGSSPRRNADGTRLGAGGRRVTTAARVF